MIIGMIPFQSVETALDNFYEVGFSKSAISLVFKDISLKEQIISDKGPMKNVTSISLKNELAKLKLNQEEIAKYISLLEKNFVLFAIKTTKRTTTPILDFMKDYDVSLLKVV